MKNTKQKEVLKGPTQLLKESWELYRKNLRTILLIMSVPLILLIVQKTVLYIFSLTVINNTIFLVIVASISALLSLIYVISSILTTMALVLSIRYKINNTIDAYKKTLPLFFSYLWVSILTALIVIGGLILLIIPGIIFAVWFALSQYALLIEEKKGHEALKRSKELTKGRVIDIAYRIIIMILIVVSILTITYFSLGAISLGVTVIVCKFSVPVSNTVLQVLGIISKALSTSFKWLVITPVVTLFWIHLYDLLLKDKSSNNNT